MGHLEPPAFRAAAQAPLLIVCGGSDTEESAARREAEAAGGGTSRNGTTQHPIDAGDASPNPNPHPDGKRGSRGERDANVEPPAAVASDQAR